MIQIHSSTRLIDDLKARTVTWLIAGSAFAFLFSCGVSWVNLRSSAERETQLELNAMAKSFRGEILSGQIKAAESQMRQALQLKHSESVKVLNENMHEVFDDAQTAHVNWDPRLQEGHILWSGLFTLSSAVPVYFDQEKTSLFGYIAVSHNPDLNWQLFLTIFGSLMAGQLIFAWIYRVSVIRVGSSLSRQLEALSTSLDHRLETADPSSSEIAELNSIRMAFQRAKTELTTLQSGRTKNIRQVAHDIRSPLSAMTLGIRSLPEIPAPTRELLEAAFRRMEVITSEILEERHTQLLSAHALNETFDNLLREKCSEHLDRQIAFGLDFQFMFGEPVALPLSALLRHISNLLNNAAEASPENGLVELRIRTHGKFLHISVIDQGPGIPLHVQPAILRGGVSSKPEGHGLGLSSARRFARTYGGDLMLAKRDNGFEVEVSMNLEALAQTSTPSLASREIV